MLSDEKFLILGEKFLTHKIVRNSFKLIFIILLASGTSLIYTTSATTTNSNDNNDSGNLIYVNQLQNTNPLTFSMCYFRWGVKYNEKKCT